MRVMVFKTIRKRVALAVLCATVWQTVAFRCAGFGQSEPFDCSIRFLTQPACYVYTGKPITPSFSVIAPDGQAIPAQNYEYRVTSQDTQTESAGTKVGTVTFSITPATGQSFSAMEASFRIVASGDCNLDNVLDAKDAKSLQSWLTDGDALVCWQAADVSQDRRLNAVDLTLLKQAVLRQTADLGERVQLKGLNTALVKPALRAEMAAALMQMHPDFPFADFAFDLVAIEQMWKETPEFTVPIGKTYQMQVYHRDTLLRPDAYTLCVDVLDTGETTLRAPFLTEEALRQLDTRNPQTIISVEQAIAIAKTYAQTVSVPPELTGRQKTVPFHLTKMFGSNTACVIDSLADARLAYVVSDEDYSVSAPSEDPNASFSLKLQVYVDAITGDVLDHQVSVIHCIA